jgi:hypothetical protein
MKFKPLIAQQPAIVYFLEDPREQVLEELANGVN